MMLISLESMDQCSMIQRRARPQYKAGCSHVRACCAQYLIMLTKFRKMLRLVAVVAFYPVLIYMCGSYLSGSSKMNETALIFIRTVKRKIWYSVLLQMIVIHLLCLLLIMIHFFSLTFMCSVSPNTGDVTERRHYSFFS